MGTVSTDLVENDEGGRRAPMTFIRLFRQVSVQVAAMGTLCGFSWGQVALVSGHVSACSTPTCTLAAASGSGNLLVVGIQILNSSTVTVTTVTDNAGNAYTQVPGARAVDTSANQATDIWYAKNSLAGATAVTISTSAAVTGGSVIWEFSGADPSAPLDQAAALNSQASTAAPAGAAVTTSIGNEAVVSIVAAGGTITGISSGNSFVNDSTLTGNGWAHLIASTAGSYSAIWVENPAGTYASSSVSFKSAGTSGPSTCDVNGDGNVNVLDVQLITNMEMQDPGFPCSVNIGGMLQCSDSARQVVIKAALGGGCHFVVVSWTPSPSSGIIGYNIYRGTSSGGESASPLNASGPIAGTSYTDTTTVSGTTYYFVVKATDGNTESPPSIEASVTSK